MTSAEFETTIYIAAELESVWKALFDVEQTRRYWVRHRNASDWKVGSRWEHQDCDDAAKVDILGRVLEIEPPRQLVVSWAAPADAADESKHSRVTITVAPFMGSTRVTVRHDLLEPGSAMHEGIREGWPIVLSSLKSLLETGHPLSMTDQRWEGGKRKSEGAD